MDDASRSLGFGKWATLRRVHMPMLRGSLLTAGLLGVRRCHEGVSATLVIRPSTSTPSPTAHTLAVDERSGRSLDRGADHRGGGLAADVLVSRQILRAPPELAERGACRRENNARGALCRAAVAGRSCIITRCPRVLQSSRAALGKLPGRPIPCLPVGGKPRSLRCLAR